MMRRHVTYLTALGLALGLLAACGDRASRGRGSAGTPGAVPFEGRDSKQVLAAFPESKRDVLEQAESTTLYTLNPVQMADGKLSPEKERFRNYGILGTVELSAADQHRRMVEAVYEGLTGENAGPAGCFFPRHGLRFTKGDEVVDLLICFECTWVYIYADGLEQKHERRMLFGAGIKPVFDSLVKEHGLPQDGGGTSSGG